MNNMTERDERGNHLTDTVIGHCGVDSGTLMIVDPCYVLDDHAEGADRSRYLDTVMPTCEAPFYNETEEGVAVSTLYGDGTYPVHAMVDAKGRIHAIYVNLGDEPQDDDDDEEDWDAVDDNQYICSECGTIGNCDDGCEEEGECPNEDGGTMSIYRGQS